MSANYVNIQGGTTYVLNLKDNQSMQNNQIRLICQTLGGAITIQMPKISDIGNSIDAKIFIDDGDDNASVNNITIVCDPADTIQNAPSYSINTNGGKIEVYIASKTEFGVIVSGTPPALPSPINVGRCLFVSQSTGNDGTALPYRFDKMYSSIAGAIADFTIGDTIIVYAGNYNNVSNIAFDDGVIYAMAGVTLNSFGTIISDVAMSVGKTFSLYGNAKINGSSGYPLNFSANGNINIEADEIIGDAGVYATIWYQKVDGIVNIKANYITGNQNSTMYLFGSNSTAKLNITAGLIENKTSSPYEMMIYMASAFAGDVTINAEKILASANRGTFGNIIANQSGGGYYNFKIFANEIVDPSGSGVSFLAQSDVGTLQVVAKKYVGTSLAFSGFSAGGSTSIFNIDYALLSGVVVNNASADIYTLVGYYESSNNGVSGSIINSATGRMRLTDFYYKGTGGSAGVHIVAGSLLFIDEATIVTNANGFEAPAPAFIFVNGRATTSGAIVNVTNGTIGTIFLTDPNINL